jgi:YVTN family beta-propeller protein
MTAREPDRTIGLVGALLLIATTGPAAAEQFLYVHNTNSGELSKIAIPEHEVVAEIEVGLFMDFVTASPDEKTLYVSLIEPMEVPGMPPRNIGTSGHLVAIDAATDTVSWKVPIDGMTHHPAVSKDGRLVFVPLYDTWWVAVVDVEQRAVVDKIFVGHGTHGTKMSADGKRLYVGSMMNDVLAIIDVESRRMVDRIGFRDGVRPFALTRDERRVYVQLSRFHGFEVVDPRTKERIRSVELPDLGRDVSGQQLYPHNVNHGIALTPDEGLLLVNGSVIDTVFVYSHPELELLARIPVGRDPNSIAFSKDGRFAYVSNRGSDDLSILDVAERREVKRLKLGSYPQRMVVIGTPD